MVELDKIKKYIEIYTGFEDIGIEKRDFYYTRARFVYYKLCKNYTDYSLAKIGDVVNRDHATVLHGLKRFEHEYVYNKYTFELFDSVNDKLKKYLENDSPLDFLDFKDVFQLHNHYKVKHIKHTEKYHSVLNVLVKKNRELKEKFSVLNKNLFSDISKLNENELIELESRINLFIKVKNHLKGSVNNASLTN